MYVGQDSRQEGVRLQQTPLKSEFAGKCLVGERFHLQATAPEIVLIARDTGHKISVAPLRRFNGIYNVIFLAGTHASRSE
jgi:hypothetical protein